MKNCLSLAKSFKNVADNAAGLVKYASICIMWAQAKDTITGVQAVDIMRRQKLNFLGR